MSLSFPERRIWTRFAKNKSALLALAVILIVILLSIFCYEIAPDNTPNADLQTLEIQAKNPGYKQQFLKIPQSIDNTQNVFQSFFFGKKSEFSFIPINKYQIVKDSIIVDKYTGIENKNIINETYSINTITDHHPEKLLSNNIITKKYWLGTDKFGRDMLSRLIVGTRVSLCVGLVAVIISLTLGFILGAAAGYYKGKTDSCIMWFVNVVWSIPTLLLVFAITILMGKGFWQVFIAIGLTMWVNVARLVRGQTMAIKEMEFIQAAKVLGLSNTRIIVKHIMPNISGPLLVLAANNFATAIIIEAGLSFLGIGVQPPQPSWGLMIKENYNFIITHQPLMALIPGLAIIMLVLAFNIVGNALRDAVDTNN